MFQFLKGWTVSEKVVLEHLGRLSVLMYALDSHAYMRVSDAFASLRRTMGFDIPPNAKRGDQGIWKDPENGNLYVGISDDYSDDPKVTGFHIDGANDAHGLLYQGFVYDDRVEWQASLYPHINPPMLAVALVQRFKDITQILDEYDWGYTSNLDRQRVLTVRRSIAKPPSG